MLTTRPPPRPNSVDLCLLKLSVAPQRPVVTSLWYRPGRREAEEPDGGERPCQIGRTRVRILVPTRGFFIFESQLNITKDLFRFEIFTFGEWECGDYIAQWQRMRFVPWRRGFESACWTKNKRKKSFFRGLVVLRLFGFSALGKRSKIEVWDGKVTMMDLYPTFRRLTNLHCLILLTILLGRDSTLQEL